MTLKDIVNTRLSSQQITTTKFKTPKDLVSWMGAIQAQDYPMSKWAIGARLPGSTNKQVDAALDKGEILRTHVLRPTWHLVSAEDIHWMLDLTANRIKAAMKFMNKELELTEHIYKKANAIIQKAVAGGNHLTREELASGLGTSKIATNKNRLSHFLIRAELDGIICSGAGKGGKQTYALLADRVSPAKKLNKEEALAKLAGKYFSSHCPATLQDFTWWSGLSVTDAKDGLEIIKKDLIAEKIDNETYWLPYAFSPGKNKKPFAGLLPAYDEFIISYKDRTACLSMENQAKAFTKNGIFRPVIIVNGIITGLWKRTFSKDGIIIETGFFHTQSKQAKNLVRKSAMRYGQFLDNEIASIYDTNDSKFQDQQLFRFYS